MAVCPIQQSLSTCGNFWVNYVDCMKFKNSFPLTVAPHMASSPRIKEHQDRTFYITAESSIDSAGLEAAGGSKSYVTQPGSEV